MCWIFCVCLTAIQTSKEHEVDEGFADVIEKGWLIKEGANDDSRRKRQVVNFRHINPVITPQKQNILWSQPCLRTLLQTRLLANQSLRTMLGISYREVTQLLVNQQFSLWPTRVRVPTGRRQTSLLFTSVTEELNSGLPRANPVSVVANSEPSDYNSSALTACSCCV